MELLRRRCSPAFTGNAFARTWSSCSPACCIAQVHCSTRSDFDGDENAIVDFKYSSSPKITWWFDHHQSAFLTPEDAAHFEQGLSNCKFYDPDFKSCTSFIAMIARRALRL